MEPRVTRVWVIQPPPVAGAGAGGPPPHVKKPALVAIANSHIANVAAKVKKEDIHGRTRLILQAPNQFAGRIDEVFAAVRAAFDASWTMTPAATTEEDTEHFTGRKTVITPEGISGGADSSGAQHAGAEVESVSSVLSARLLRAETGLAAMAAEKEAAEAAAKEAAEARAAAEAAAKEAAEAAAKEAAAKEAALAEVAQLKAQVAALLAARG